MKHVMDTEMRTHRIKCWEPFFEDVMCGRKTFEVRKNDRDYRIGDRLKLVETKTGGDVFTGRELDVEIIYILHGGAFGLEAHYCALGIQFRRAAPAPAPEAVEAAKFFNGRHPDAWTLDKVDKAVLNNDEISPALTEAILAATKLARGKP